MVLVGASLVSQAHEQTEFTAVNDWASANYNHAILLLKAAVLEAEDLNERVCVHLIDVGYSQKTNSLNEDVLEQVVLLNPDVVGLSCYCWSLEELLSLAGEVRGRCPRVLVIAGGPSAGPHARALLAAHGSVHAVARGESEPTFLSFLRALLKGESLGAVVGLTWRDVNGKIRENADPPPVDLALLPSPCRLGVLPRAFRSMLVETSRGCEYRCQFCTFMGPGRKLRYVPVAHLEADLRWAVEHGVKHVSFADTAINFNTDRLRELVDAVHRADPDCQLRFCYFVKLELVTSEQADILSSIPTDEVIVGIETYTPAARKAMGKSPLTPEDFGSKAQLLQRVGPISPTLILGLPGDTLAGLERTLLCMFDFDREHPGWFSLFCLFWLFVLPGSRLDMHRNRFGFRCATAGGPFALQSSEHDPDTFLRMARLSIELYYAHPKMRVAEFHIEYLAQDAPAPDRIYAIERCIDDSRPCVLLYGEIDNTWRAFGLEPYNLPIAWLKAFAEKHDDLRCSFRFVLATEKEDFAALVSEHRPVWIVRSCLRAPDPSDAWQAHVVDGKGVSLFLVGACSQQEAEAWMLAVPQATVAAVGEGEIAFRSLLLGNHNAPGLVRRGDGRLVFTGPCEVVRDLDDIPSPYQWEFIRRSGRTIAMRLGRSSPPRFWSEERLYRDIRWAIEHRHDHILWLDESLPSDEHHVSRLIGAIRRLDSSGSLFCHSYRLDGTQTPKAMKELSLLRAHTIFVTRKAVNLQWMRAVHRIAALHGADVKWEGKNPGHRPELEQLAQALEPLKHCKTLPGWQMVNTSYVYGTVEAQFVWNGGPTVKMWLLLTEEGVKAALEANDVTQPPDSQVARLQSAVTVLVGRRNLSSQWKVLGPTPVDTPDSRKGRT